MRSKCSISMYVLYVAGWEPIDFKMPLNGACRCSKNSEFQNLKNSPDQRGKLSKTLPAPAAL